MEKMNIFIESTKFMPRLVDDKLLPVKIQPRQQRQQLTIAASALLFDNLDGKRIENQLCADSLSGCWDVRYVQQHWSLFFGTVLQ